MSYFSAFIYGLIQGLTEFLPVSSSGHLAILPHILSVEDPGVFFDILMHVGTALSVIVYYWAWLKRLFFKLPFIFVNKMSYRDKDLPFLRNCIFTTLVTVGFVFFFQEGNGFVRAHPKIMAFNFAFFGLLLFLADKYCTLSPFSEGFQTEKRLLLKKGFVIGLAQALAVFPGVSRSGATLTAARFMNLSRAEATHFSFLLSLPMIFAGLVMKGREFFKGVDIEGLLKSEKMYSEILSMVGPSLLGIFVSFVVGIAAIHFFIKIFQRMGPWVFMVYRFFIATLLFYYL